MAVVAQLVERVLGKDEVTSSILVNGSSFGGERRPAGMGTCRAIRALVKEKKTWRRKNLIAASRT